MAVLPDYVSGTITLANGSTTVTGTGTMFQAAAFKAGDTLQIQNLTAVIASVNSNTSLTLTAPWTGTSLTNAVYRARYLPDGARVTAQATTLIELLGNGNLQSLAGLTSAADKGLYFSGVGTADIFDLRKGARDFLSAFAGTSTTIPNSTLPERIRAAATVITDANAATESGCYRIEGSGANTPLNTVGFINVIAQSSTVLKQIWYQRDGLRCFMRTNILGSWQSWSEVANSASAGGLALINVGGTPAANTMPYLDSSGSALLTAISAIARSVNAQGTGAQMFSVMGAAFSIAGGQGYVRLPNNVLINFGTQILAAGAQYGSFNFPMAFANMSYRCVGMNGDATAGLAVMVSRNSDGVNPAAFSWRKTVAGVGTTEVCRFDYIAIGQGA